MKTVTTKKAPEAIGPYSQAMIANGFVFCSGQIPFDPDGNLVSQDISKQTKQVLENLSNVLMAASSSLDRVVKTSIYLADINDFNLVNEVYDKFFSKSKPARETVEVSKLPKAELGVKIEISCIALV